MAEDVGTCHTSLGDLKSFEEQVQPVPDLQSSVEFQPTAAPGFPVLITAWAHLLRCYTQDERPVFRVNDDSIRFHVEEGTYVRVKTLDAGPGRRSQTGITIASGGFDHGSTKNSSTSGPTEDNQLSTNDALHLLYSTETKRGVLYASASFEAHHIAQMSRQLAVIVDWLTKRPDGPIPWTAVDEIQLSVKNYPPRLKQGPQFLHQLIHDGHSVSNDAVEFLLEDGSSNSYSYDALHRRSNSFAAVIQNILFPQLDKKSSKQPIIPILMPQSPELYIAILAILKAGAAFCPLDLDIPGDRLRYIVADVDAPLVVTDKSSASKFSRDDGRVILLAEEYNMLRKLDDITLSRLSCADSLAYVMYTSGSTGTPKGVCVSHSAVIQSLLAHDKEIPCFDRFLQFAAPAFDVFVFEMFVPLFRGKTLVGCHRNAMLGDLTSVMTRMNVDAAELTPTVAGGLLRRRAVVPSLRLLLTIGEMLTGSIVREFGGSSEKKAMLFGMYGPTEAAIHCTLVTGVNSNMKPSVIGVPLETVSAFIVSPAADGVPNGSNIEVLPIGHIGELVVGGYQLADGYLNDTAKTAQAFVTHPRYGRLYRTGDKARMLSDGNLEMLGRMVSGQVKLRGQRVELGEVEEATLKTPGIHGVSANVIDGILVVFCLEGDEHVSGDTVLHTCRQWLPNFMVPGDVIILQEFPRLVSGKVDKKSLDRLYEKRKSDMATEDLSLPTHNASFPLEQKIRDVLSSISNIPRARISLSSTIYQLGIDSLAAVHVATQLRSQGIESTVGDILEVVSPNNSN